MKSNTDLAKQVLRELARLGVREECVAAGARNAPLLAPLLASTGVTVRHFFEERCAAFFALGRLMVQREPVAVITTSGTAAGELLPAAMEAFYQGLPLVLVTADRPRRFRGSGAPQAVEQVGIFGSYAESTIDLNADDDVAAAWPRALKNKPLHVNVCLDEPLDCVSEGIDFAAVQSAAVAECTSIPTSHETLSKWLADCSDLIVLAGGIHPDDVEVVTAFLLALGAPVVAESTSNLRDRVELHALLISGGESALRKIDARRVLRIGAVPSWRWWRDLETRPDISVLNICAASFPGLARRENVTMCYWDAMRGMPTTHRPPEAPGIRLADESSAFHAHPLSEPSWMRALSERVPAGARVFLGNSLPIREWNLAAVTPKPGTSFFANRGANGIDGIVSTFLGVSADAAESWLIIGDLSALYDLSAPWILAQLPAANRRVVVINNSGGKIFSRVDSLRGLDETTRGVIENRHALSFEHWARMWGMGYLRAERLEQIASLPDGNVVIEVVPDAGQTEGFWSDWRSRE